MALLAEQIVDEAIGETRAVVANLARIQVLS